MAPFWELWLLLLCTKYMQCALSLHQNCRSLFKLPSFPFSSPHHSHHIICSFRIYQEIINNAAIAFSHDIILFFFFCSMCLWIYSAWRLAPQLSYQMPIKIYQRKHWQLLSDCKTYKMRNVCLCRMWVCIMRLISEKIIIIVEFIIIIYMYIVHMASGVP